MANEDREYLQWLRKQPCCVCRVHGPSEAHHQCGAGMGLRSHDHTAVPLCSQHHRDHHTFRGAFLGYSREARKSWQEGMAALHRARYEKE